MSVEARVIPWSHSSLGAFETCGFRYLQERVLRVIPKKTFAEAQEGIDKHKAIEDYLKSVADLQDTKLKSLVDSTLGHLDYRHLKFEHKLAVTKDRAPCSYDRAESPEVYHRGIIDVMYADPEDPVAHLFDWKNGKVNEHSDQLKANAICVMAHHPHVQRVDTNYVWMKHNHVTKGRVYRDFSAEIWTRFCARVDRMEQKAKEGVWTKNPSGLCKKHCPVTSCEFNGQRES